MKKLFANPKESVPLLAAVLIALIVVVALVITTIVRSHTYTLEQQPTTSQTPRFAEGAKAVPGWEALRLDLPANTGVRTAQYQNKQAGCTFSTTTALYPSYLANRGDEYLTKFALYDQGTQKGALIKDEANTYVRVAQGGKLQFETGQFTYKTDAAPNSPAQTFKTYTATRAIDKLYKVPASPLGSSDQLFGSDGSKGVPVLVATYSCTTNKGSLSEFNALLDAVAVDLK
jgi:hypothetical protein